MKIKIYIAIIFSSLLMFSFSFSQVKNQSGIKVRVLFSTGAEENIAPGVEVRIYSKNMKLITSGLTEDDGSYVFSSLKKGEYILEPVLEGFRGEKKKVSYTGTPISVILHLYLSQTATVTVEANTEKEEAEKPAMPQTIKEKVLKTAPLVNEKFQDALPLLPGVVRGPDGLLSLNGARESQSGLLVNSVNVTDPVTGQYAMELPIEAIESVKVYSSPYLAEFGKFTGAVTSIQTRQGTNKWKILFTNFFPRLRKRNGKIMGIESFTPRFALAGPIVKDKFWISQNFEYRFIRTKVTSLPELHNETVLETFDSFSRFDFDINSMNQFSTVFSLYPQNIRYVNLNTFRPEEAAPNYKQRGFFLAFNEKAIINLNSLLDTTFSIKDYDAHIWGNSPDIQTISPEGWRGGFFDKQDRFSRRYEFEQNFTFEPKKWHGVHNPKIGYIISHSNFDGNDLNKDVLILREDGSLYQRISFDGGTYLSQGITEVTAYAEDKWQVNSRISIDYGIRFDRDDVASKSRFAPRFGYSILPFKNTKTVIRGGFGIFFDKIPLNAAVFPQYQHMVVTTFDRGGNIINGPVEYQNLMADIENPYSYTWNIQMDRQLTKSILFRVGYLQRNQKDDLILNMVNIDGKPSILLSNNGSSYYKEFLLMFKFTFKNDSNLVFSYTRSEAWGNLNQYEYYLGNYHNPIFRPDEFGPQSFDVPHRVLITGTLNLPFKLILSPVVEIRNGFPYSIVNEEQNFVSKRNEGGRFPRFFEVDFQIMRKVPIKFFGKVYHTRIGIKMFNITHHFNPRDMQNNIDSPFFGNFYNSIGRIFRGKFEIDF